MTVDSDSVLPKSEDMSLRHIQIHRSSIRQLVLLHFPETRFPDLTLKAQLHLPPSWR
jgi:hypothetical protein